MLADKFKEYPVHVKKCPKDFKRPSFYIEFIKVSPRDICRITVEKTTYLTVTCFTPLDDSGNADKEELADLQDSVMQLFSQGYVKVIDRAITVKASTGGMDDDRAYVDLQFEYFDNRTDEKEIAPIIASVETRIQEG
jgi:hypothetical protein